MDVRPARFSTRNFETLLRTIFNTPRQKTRSGVGSPLLRLPTMKSDGWSLRSGVAANKKHPDSYFIPSQKARSSLKIDDLAKLSFEIDCDAEGAICGERMWVAVTGKIGPYYVGALSNSPISQHKYLKWNSSIVFLPEHVIDIVRAAERAQFSKESKRKPRQPLTNRQPSKSRKKLQSKSKLL